MTQLKLFNEPAGLPPGLRYRADLLTAAEERALVQAFAALSFREFEFHGFRGRRRVVSFGWQYDFNGGGLRKTDDMPAFLTPVRAKAAAFAGLSPSALQHALITEYPPGATIGWHKDRAVFGQVVGVSLLAACVFRLRRKPAAGWERAAFVAAPRSAYLLDGPARSEWEHSIPAHERLRYSITFRNLRE
jgi:alkylated DNA repair dioxygenase AlkB